MPSQLYTVIASGEKFFFTKDQLKSDPGNFFATYFLGDFKEAADGVRELEIQEEPALFRIIQASLRNYTVFPLAKGLVSYLSEEAIIQSLQTMADFYGLQKLLVATKAEIQRITAPVAPVTGKKYRLEAYHNLDSRPAASYELSETAFKAILARISSPSIQLHPGESYYSHPGKVVSWKEIPPFGQAVHNPDLIRSVLSNVPIYVLYES